MIDEDIEILKNDNFKNKTILLITADWCPYSIKFQAVWNKFIEEYNKKNKEDINIYKIYDTNINKIKRQRKNKILKNLINEFSGYPNLFLLNNKKFIKIEINNKIYNNKFNLYKYIIKELSKLNN
jgi:thiol-disulfide isomerase/thioredoxin